MDMRFLRGNPQAPKGHAIFIARSTNDPRVIYCTYCIVPPTPLSLAKYLPSFLAAQLPPEELREAANVNVMPIPPMLEEGSSLEHLEMLADRRDDDLCETGLSAERVTNDLRAGAIHYANGSNRPAGYPTGRPGRGRVIDTDND